MNWVLPCLMIRALWTTKKHNKRQKSKHQKKMGQSSSHRNQEDPFDYASLSSNTHQQPTSTTTTQPIIHKEELLHHLLLMGSSNSGKTLFAKMSNLILEGSMTSRSMKYREELLSSMFAWLLLIVCVKKKLFSELELQQPTSEQLIDLLLKPKKKDISKSLHHHNQNDETHHSGETNNEELDDRCLLQLAIVKPELLWSNDKMMKDVYSLWQNEPILHNIYAIIYFNKMSPELLFLFGNTQVGSVISGNVLDKFGHVNTVPKQPQWQHFENFNYVINHCVEIAHSLRRAQNGILDPEINFDKEFLLASNMTRGYYESEIKLKLSDKKKTETSSMKKKETKENKEELISMSEQFRSLFMIDSAGVRSDRKKWRKILLSKLYPDLLHENKKKENTDQPKKKKKSVSTQESPTSSSSSNNNAVSSSSSNQTPAAMPSQQVSSSASSSLACSSSLASSSQNSSEPISHTIYSQLKPSGVAILYFVSLTSYNQYSVDDILGLYGSTISITVDSKTPASPLLNINSDKILTVERPIEVSTCSEASAPEEDDEEQKLVSVLKSPRGTEVNLKHVDLLEKKRMKKKTLKPPKYKPLIDSASSLFLSRHQSLKHNGLLTLKNQLIDSLEFFNKTVNMPEVTNVPIILVFTKKESLKRKLVFCDFSDSFFFFFQNQSSEMVPLDPLPEEILLKKQVMIGNQKISSLEKTNNNKITNLSSSNPITTSPPIVSSSSFIISNKNIGSDVSPRLISELKTSKLLLNRLKKEYNDEDDDEDRNTRVESPVIEQLVSETPSEQPSITHHSENKERKNETTCCLESSLQESPNLNEPIKTQPLSECSTTLERQSLTRDRLLDVSSVGMAIGERRQLDNRCVSVSINLTTLEQQLELQRRAIQELMNDTETMNAMTETCLKFSDPYEKKVPLTEDDLKEPEQPRMVSEEYSNLVIDYIAKQFLNQVKSEEKRKQIEKQIIVLDIFNRDEMKKVLKELINKTC